VLELLLGDEVVTVLLNLDVELVFLVKEVELKVEFDNGIDEFGIEAVKLDPFTILNCPDCAKIPEFSATKLN